MTDFNADEARRLSSPRNQEQLRRAEEQAREEGYRIWLVKTQQFILDRIKVAAEHERREEMVFIGWDIWMEDPRRPLMQMLEQRGFHVAAGEAKKNSPDYEQGYTAVFNISW